MVIENEEPVTVQETHPKVLDFRNMKITSQSGDQFNIELSKEEVYGVIDDEGLGGFFGISKEELKKGREKKKVGVPVT